MPRGIKNLKPSGIMISDQIWIGLQTYPSLNAAADAISSVAGFEAVTARKLQRWVEKSPDALGKKVHRLLMLRPGAIELAQMKDMKLLLQEAHSALANVAGTNKYVVEAEMRIEFALGDCNRLIRRFHHINRRRAARSQ